MVQKLNKTRPLSKFHSWHSYSSYNQLSFDKLQNQKKEKVRVVINCFISVKFLLWYPSRNTESTNLIKLAVNLSKRYSSDKRSWYIICMERYYVGSVHDSMVFLVAFSLDLSLLFSLKVILICFPVFIVKCYSREVSFRDQFSWLKFCIISWMQLYIFCESTY